MRTIADDRTNRFARALLVAALLATGCSSGGDPLGGEAPGATDAADADPTGSPDAPDRWPSLEVGPELDPADVSLAGAGFAWQLDGAVLLTGTTGLPEGHLVDFTLDRGASDRLAAPVLLGPDGQQWLVTADGLVHLVPGATIPLVDGGAHLVLGESTAIVVGPDGAERTTLDGGLSSLWVSATATVVGTYEGVAHDVQRDLDVELEPGCRVADRHTPEEPLLVCDDGSRLGDGTPAPDGGRFGWTTVGTTGDEYLATVHVGAVPMAVIGERGAEPTTVAAPGVALFFRSTGTAWIASPGPTGSLAEVDPSERRPVVLRDMPGVLDAMVWTR